MNPMYHVPDPFARAFLRGATALCSRPTASGSSRPRRVLVGILAHVRVIDPGGEPVKKLTYVVLVTVLLALVATPAVSQVTPQEFESIINFEDSIEWLATLVRTGAYDRIDVDRYYVLDGSVASTQIFNPDPESFQAVIELVSSKWIGMERIEAYHIYVLVEGPEYAARIPERMPRDPGDEIIQTNQNLLVIGPFIGTAMLDASTEVAVIQAVALR